MNKLIIILIAFFVTPSVVAMDIMTLTNAESENFTALLSKIVFSGETMIKENKIAVNHPLHCIHSKLLKKVNVCKDGLVRTIQDNKDLHDVIKFRVKSIDKMEDVQELKNDIFNQTFDDDFTPAEALRRIIWARKMHADELLQELYPVYFKNMLDKTEEEDRTNFMIKNEHYPTDEQSEQNYIVTLIYKYTLAQRAPYGIKY